MSLRTQTFDRIVGFSSPRTQTFDRIASVR
jgi:hypothetical protein